MKKLLPLVLSAAVLILAGCDAAGSEETIILNNANSERDARPTVEYTFEYQTDGSGSIGVGSKEADDLNAVLATVGFTRSDVVSARVDSVRLERLSPKDAPVPQKVFDYLSGATVYLGTDDGGKRIAEATFETTAESVRLQVVGASVTDVVKRGATPAYLQLDTANDVPDRTDRVQVTVFFRLEVRGA